MNDPIAPNAPLPSTPRRRSPWRVVVVLAGVVLAGGAVSAAYIYKTPPPKVARSIGARLDLAAGDVTVGDRGSAISGMPLATGSTIAAGKGARALVRTGEGAAIFLRAETELKLLDHGVELASGEIWLDAPRIEGDALEIKIGSSTVSASDAGISVRRDGNDITVYVARGLAILSSPGGRVEIGAGEQGKSSGDGRPLTAAVKFWNDWTGGMGDQRGSRFIGSGTGRLYGIDPAAPPGSPARKLGIAKQVVHGVIRDGIAETEVDQTFSNPGATPIEGYYWFTVPAAATVTGFALETNGQLVEGEVIEKREAATQYAAAMRQGNEPALLEWVDGRTYRARIFPVPQAGTRRIVLRYVEMLPVVEGKTRYTYPLRSDDPVRFDEFALSVDLGGTEDDVEVASSLDARVENGRNVSMRRSGYIPRADFQLELTQKKKRRAVSAWRFSAGTDQADYVMVRYVPDKDFAKLASPSADVVLVVDTSAGGDESSRQLRIAAAEAALRALSDRDHFALVALDVSPTVVYPQDGLATATSKDIDLALEKLSEHAIGGATDLGAMFEPALARLHGKDQAAVIYVGDGTPTSGETSAEALTERLRRSLTGSRARFFAIGAGAGASHELLGELARAGGGQYVRIDESTQTTGQALRLASAIKTPTITDLAIDLGAGLDQPLFSATGKLSRGEELVLLARTHHPLPAQINVRGRLGGEPFDDRHEVKLDTTSATATLVPRLWAAEYVRRLMGSASHEEDNRGQILQLGVEYGLITPYTSSLALEDEMAYARQGIQRRSTRVRGVRLTAIDGKASEDNLVHALLPGAPEVAMGCSKRSMDESESTPARAVGSPPPAQPVQIAPPPPETPAASAFASGRKDENGAAKNEDGVYGLKAPDAPPTKQRSFGDFEPKGGGGGEKTRPGGVMKAAHATTITQRETPQPVAPAMQNAQTKEAHHDESDRSTVENDKQSLARRPPSRRLLGACSDVASRPLAERLVLWKKRAARATTAPELSALYTQAYTACELPDWRDEAALLDVIGGRIQTEGTAEQFLRALSGQPDAARFVGKNLMRRTVDAGVAAAVSRVLYGGVDWNKVDLDLSNETKIERKLSIVKAAMHVAPSDLQGDVRYVDLLAKAGDRQEAIAHGRRLRDRGFLTPTLARELGDVLAEGGEKDEALRTYSEIVEFDGESRDSRRVLGDIFYRQGWYPQAYRQYKTLTDLDPKNPLAWLRLANAAAGAGRVDEALRIEREVAGGEGSPGPDDPRQFARLLSAARLGALLATPDPSATPDAIGRKLKELSLFSGPGTLSLLVWDDLDARLVIGPSDEKKEDTNGETTDGGAVGIFALLGSTESWAAGGRAVRVRSDLVPRKVTFRVLALAWDGRSFKVTTRTGELVAGTKQALL